MCNRSLNRSYLMRLLSKTIPALLFALTLSSGALAQDTDDYNDVFAGDRYAAGEDVTVSEATDGDLFAAGEEVTVAAATGQSAHLFARRVAVTAPVDGSLYAAGYSIDIAAEIGGGASLFASEITIDAAIAGNLRAFARDLEINAPVAGGAVIGAAEVEINSPIEGDLLINSEEIDWGDAAEVSGALVVYTKNGEAIDIPSRVAARDQVSFRDANAFEDDMGVMQEWQQGALRRAILGFLMSVLTVAVLATITIALAEPQVARWRARALSHPLGSLGAGFVAISTVIGAGVVFAFTLIGFPLTLAALLIAAIAAYAGYVMGSYILGVGVWRAVGRPLPNGVVQKAGLAVLGALVAALIGLIPFAGWLFNMALAFGGLGTIVMVWRESRALAAAAQTAPPPV